LGTLRGSGRESPVNVVAVADRLRHRQSA
jgi:hypothetical protein